MENSADKSFRSLNVYILKQPERKGFPCAGCIFLPFIVYFFGKAYEIFYFNDCTVVENGASCKSSKDLMLVGANDACIGIGVPVDNRYKVHLKTSVA